MNNSNWLFVALGVIALAAGAYVFFQNDAPNEGVTPVAVEAASDDVPARPQSPLAEVPTKTEETSPPIEGQQEEAAAPEPTPEPLPKLAESDAPLLTEATPLFGTAGVPSFLQPTDFIERLVVTVDNLDRGPIRMNYRPLRHVPKPPVVSRKGLDSPKLYLTADNASRYSAYMHVLEILDAKQVARLYQRYAPLFQQAYKELGYPRSQFDDRLIAVIEHLRATPLVDFPIALVQPKVLYEFADPKLEALSWGQKTLIRMGPKNAAKVKSFLQDLQSALEEAPN